jgi:hypothetical protein
MPITCPAGTSVEATGATGEASCLAHRPRAAAKINNVITRLDHGRLTCPVTKSPRRGQRVLIAQQGNHLCNRFVVLGRGMKQRWDLAGRLRSCHSGGDSQPLRAQSRPRPPCWLAIDATSASEVLVAGSLTISLPIFA